MAASSAASRRSSPRPSASRASASRATELDRAAADAAARPRAASWRDTTSDIRRRSPTSSSATSFSGEPMPGHRLRVRAAPAVPAGDHARRGQRAGPRLVPRAQPRRRRDRAGQARRGVPTRRQLAAVDQGDGRAAAHGLRRHRHARRRCSAHAADAGRDRRRPRPTPAPGITEWQLSNGVRSCSSRPTFKAGRDPVPGREPGGTSLASDDGLHPGRAGRAGGRASAASAISASTDLRQGADRQGRVGVVRSSASTSRGSPAARRRRISRRCSSSSTCVSRRRGPTRNAFGVLTSQMKAMLAEPGARTPDSVFRPTLIGDPGAEPSAGAADDGRDARPDESRQVAGVLQGPLRRRERLHVRVRRQLRSRSAEAAGRAVPGVVAFAGAPRKLA